MDARATARSLSDGRAAVGAACFAAPELTTRVWIGDDAGRTGARLLAPALGAREVALGAAAHAAPGRGAPARPSISSGAACDAVDLTLALLDRLPRGAAVLVARSPGAGRPWPRHWSVSLDSRDVIGAGARGLIGPGCWEFSGCLRGDLRRSSGARRLI